MGFDWRRLFDAAVPKARHLKARHGSAGKASLDHIESRRDGTLAEHPLRIERNSRFPQHRLKLAFVGSLLMVLCLMGGPPDSNHSKTGSALHFRAEPAPGKELEIVGRRFFDPPVAIANSDMAKPIAGLHQ